MDIDRRESAVKDESTTRENRRHGEGNRVTMAAVSGEISNLAWNAILKRDRHHDGKFVYAALTTGIYCRPSCPARHPHRRNTLLFVMPASVGL
jgi:hypothetical protein